MGKITILYLIDNFIGMAGAEKNLFHVVTGLDLNKYRPIVCCLQGGDVIKILEQKGIQVINLQMKKIYDINAFKQTFRLIKLIKREDVQVIVTYHKSSDFWGGMIAKICNVPVIISNRRDMGYKLKKKDFLVYKIINKLVFNKIIAVSNAVKKMIVCRQTTPEDKIVTIYNGVELERFSEEVNTDQLRHSLGLNSKQPVVGILAVLRPIKGHKYFLEAASIILKEIPTVQFLVVGYNRRGIGVLEDNPIRLSETLGIRENVFFTGRQSDTPKILSIMDISILTSLSEGFSNTILESMAAGKPVVATNVGGNLEAIIEGETGFLVPPKNPEALAEAIIKLLENKSLAHRMGMAGKERVKQHFPLEKMIRETESLYDSLLEKMMIRREGSVQRERRDVRLFLSKLMKLSLSASLYYTGLFIVIREILRLLPHQRGIKILAYHRVNDSGPDYLSLNTSVANFESQIRYLKRHFKIISLEEAVQLLRSNKPISEDLFVITFDDGYKDNYINAFPILKKYKTPATIFLTLQPLEDRIPLWFENITGIIEITSQEFLNLECFGLGKYPLSTPAMKKKTLNDIITYAKELPPQGMQKLVDFLSEELKVNPHSLKFNDQMLSWKEIGEMRSYGISFGSHTISHSILTRLPLEKAKYEIEKSKELLEGKLSEKISFFAYPNGSKNDFNGEIIQVLKDSGFSAACTLISGFNKGNTDLFALRRVCMTEGISVGFKGEFLEPYFALQMAGIFDVFPLRFLKKKFAESATSWEASD